MLYFVEISPFWLLQTNTVDVYVLSFYHPPGMEKADSHPALLYEALLPFLTKEVIQLRRAGDSIVGRAPTPRVTKKKPSLKLTGKKHLKIDGWQN